MLFCCLWRNVETSCHTLRRCFPPSTNSTAYQRLVYYKLAWSVAAKYIALAAGMVPSRQWRQILAQNRDFCLPHLHSTSPLGAGGGASEYCHAVWCGKTRMVWLPDGEKKSKISLFVFTEYTNVTDTQTDGRTDTAWRLRPRLYSIARRKPVPVSDASGMQFFLVSISGSEWDMLYFRTGWWCADFLYVFHGHYATHESSELQY